MIIKINPREISAGAIAIFALSFAFTLFIDATYERAAAVLDCVQQLRNAETVPEAVWNADNLHEAEIRWCNGFVSRGGEVEGS